MSDMRELREKLVRRVYNYRVGGEWERATQFEQLHCYQIVDHLMDDIDTAGYAVVPKEPTEEMLGGQMILSDEDARSVWEGMLEVITKEAGDG